MGNSKGIAVVTGASTGIGAIYAERLAGRGYDLLLVARSADRLEQVADGIRAKHGRRADVFAADLSEPSDLARLEKFLSTSPDVEMLVNNAGLGGALPLLKSDPDNMSRMIALNVTAPMRLTYAVVPQFVARGRGTIVNISSIVAINPEALNGVYGGTKAFVLAFSQNLRRELEGTGVEVQVVLPGATRTDFWAISGRPVELLPDEIVMNGEDLVEAALVGLDHKEFVTIPSLQKAELFEAYENARRAMFGKLSNAKPAARYAAEPSHRIPSEGVEA